MAENLKGSELVRAYAVSQQWLALMLRHKGAVAILVAVDSYPVGRGW